MQNKKIYIGALVGFFIMYGAAAVLAQAKPAVPKPDKPAVSAPAAKPAAKPAKPDTKQPAKPDAKQPAKPAAEKPAPPRVSVPEDIAPAPVAPVMPDAAADIGGEAAPLATPRVTIQDLGDATPSSDKAAVDFPNRPSLGELKYAPLPGIKETNITGPAPAAPAVSQRDLPNEQLLGRVTSEIFQEMADLERGNTFLQLQKQKETFKNDLENLKSSYRQARLKEIADREEVVRSRIKWWQDQEQIRLDIERKRAEEEQLAQQIADREALREKLWADMMGKADAAAGADAEKKPVVFVLGDLFDLVGVRGTRGVLTAQLKQKRDGVVRSLNVGDTLVDNWKITDITRDAISATNGELVGKVTLTAPPAQQEKTTEEK
ncbi:MAG: hypothetical protein PHX68_00720 [Alphaproteobacteria bacterium]|nr:hypothetical protein [Alphaproteobacteria bacterium]